VRSPVAPVAGAARPDLPARYLDVPGAARYLGCGERMVRRLVHERRIAFVKVGRHVRLDTVDLDSFLAAGRVEPTRAEVA